MNVYAKYPITIADQIEMLRSRGLIISDTKYAESQLSKISYFRLANYWFPMEQDKTRHKFKPHSTFENVMHLYSFDKELRNIIFSGIQTIEIALRSKVIQHVSLKHGAFWFADANLFANKAIFQKCFDTLREEMARSKEEFLADHFAKYDTPPFPPAWKILEISSFGTTAKLYSNIKDVKLKKTIAREFGLPQHLILESWIKSIAALRNCVAHHARIWNRKYPMMPQMPATLPLPWIKTEGIQKERLYAILSLLLYLLQVLEEDVNFRIFLKELFKRYPNSDIVAMGFPKDWQNEPLWK